MNKTTIIFKDDETTVTVVKKGGDCFSVHLGNDDFELEMSKKELEAMRKLINKALSC